MSASGWHQGRRMTQIEEQAIATDRVAFAPPSVTQEDVDAVVRVLRSRWLTTGTECHAFELELAACVGAHHVVAVSSCTAALEICLEYLRLPPGALVAIPTWTFASTGLAAARVGAQPVLIDVDERDLNMSPTSLKRTLAERRVRAVIAVHVGGVPVDRGIRTLCAEARIPLIEDAAHALGAHDDRGPVNGSSVVAACYSFYATKNLSSGEGGAIATFDARLDEFARVHRLHGLDCDAWARYQPGSSGGYELVRPGIKANFPDVLAALARSQLRRFHDMQLRRGALVKRYRDNLAGCEAVSPLPERPAPGSANHLMLVKLGSDIDRDAVRTRLVSAGIATSIHFQPLHTFRWFADHAALPPGGVGVADRMASRVLSLPLHVGLGDADVDRVCDALISAI
jgi:dTDP-4-amino-4,6-dideoxygalactose transaminase